MALCMRFEPRKSSTNCMLALTRVYKLILHYLKYTALPWPMLMSLVERRVSRCVKLVTTTMSRACIPSVTCPNTNLVHLCTTRVLLPATKSCFLFWQLLVHIQLQDAISEQASYLSGNNKVNRSTQCSISVCSFQSQLHVTNPLWH